jgi:hypothetical protein
MNLDVYLNMEVDTGGKEPGHAISEGGEVMDTSTVTIEGGAFVIRTGNLLTKFKSLESAAEQIALLHDEIEQLQNENRRLKKACELYRQASIQSHRGHVQPRHPELQGDWDPTGKWGAGCPECDRASQLRSEAEAFLKGERISDDG